MNMFFLLLLLWIIFNGKISAEIVITGIVISLIIYLFICKFMDYSVKKDVGIMKMVPLLIYYLLVLLREIIKANFATIKMITTCKYETEPVLIKFKTTLKTKFARVILADSITLTPGTITASLEEDELTVHCLDRDFAEGIENSVFVKLLEKMESMNG